MKSMIKRFANWLYGRGPAINLAVGLAIRPGILLATLFMPFKSGDHYNLGWIVAYVVINVIALGLGWSVDAAILRLQMAERGKDIRRLTDAVRGEGEARTHFLQEVIKARMRAESYPPEHRAELLRRFDLITAPYLNPDHDVKGPL